jgi:hypothetical protein
MKLTALALSGLVAIVLAAVLVAPALGTDPAGGDPLLQSVRAVSARYHSVQQAEQAGYVRASGCESSPAGGMGYHYLNPGLARDPAIDPLRPEVLLYAPKGDNLELVGVEYFRRAADQEAPFDQSDKPSLFGRGFDGVMPEHSPGMGWHYDLHVWLWEMNPSGLLAPWNPAVTCP